MFQVDRLYTATVPFVVQTALVDIQHNRKDSCSLLGSEQSLAGMLYSYLVLVGLETYQTHRFYTPAVRRNLQSILLGIYYYNQIYLCFLEGYSSRLGIVCM